MCAAAVTLVLAGSRAPSSEAKQLKPKLLDAFVQYVHTREAGMNQELAAGKNFLWIDSPPEPGRETKRTPPWNRDRSSPKESKAAMETSPFQSQ